MVVDFCNDRPTASTRETATKCRNGETEVHIAQPMLQWLVVEPLLIFAMAGHQLSSIFAMAFQRRTQGELQLDAAAMEVHIAQPML